MSNTTTAFDTAAVSYLVHTYGTPLQYIEYTHTIRVCLLLLLEQVLVALLVGIWAGALLVSGFNPLSAFLRTFDTYFVGAFVGEGNAEVLLFTFLLGGTIGLVQRSGGALGLANALKRFMGETERGGGGACSFSSTMRVLLLQ